MPTFYKFGKRYKYYTQEQLSQIFKKITSQRDRALFNVIYKYGLRRSEAGLLLKDDVDFKRNVIIIRRKKGSISREHRLYKDTRALISAYLRDRGPDDCLYLFATREKKGISSSMVDHLWEKYVKASKVFGHEKDKPRQERKGIYNVHALKHSIAVHLRDSGKTLDEVQYVIGHKKRDSTEIYAQVSDKTDEELTRSIDRSPLIVSMEP